MKSFVIQLVFGLMPILVSAQFSLSGKILDSETQNPLSWANIILAGTNKATAADIDGTYRIENINVGSYQMKISFVGYKTYEQLVRIERDQVLEVALEKNPWLADEVIVTATRATELSPTTFTWVTKQEIERNNLGQDLPFLLDQTPSVVVTSDAGTGVGYTGIRIRGSDPTRVNVTINGIPLNDSESQGMFWVDLPDLASSVDNIQIQRGVGTSTNGAGAFGASLNIKTATHSEKPFAQIDNSFGSFNTRKHTFMAGTGLINDRLVFDARLSKIESDGYIDRATADLQSYFVSGSYLGKNSLVKANIFSGSEITYQSWDGVNQSNLETDRTFNTTGQIDANTFYKNQVDDYKQDHYQLHYSVSPVDKFTFTSALHYTKGKGFFEQYKVDDALTNYGLADVILGNDTITNTDLVRRRWLDNDFYGFTYSFNFQPNKRLMLILGGAWNNYKGDHFGEVIWAEFASNSSNTDRYYQNTGEKQEFNTYLKADYRLSSKVILFGDLQYRSVDYGVSGTDNDLRILDIQTDFDFFNPKAGVTFLLDNRNKFYASYAVGQREPDRNDFVDAPIGLEPQSEKLQNLELGYKRTTPEYFFSANYYLMDYQDQLVLSGELNDVGTPIRTNVDKSFRTGLELAGAFNLTDYLTLKVNATYSVNKIKEFSETAAIFDNFSNFNFLRDTTIVYKDTDIILSPTWIAGADLSFRPWRPLEISFISKYVGDQFLDNKSSDDRKLDGFFVNGLLLSYTRDYAQIFLKELKLIFRVNNLFDVEYEPNGYTYFLLFDDGNQITVFNDNFYYPQAGTNVMAGLSLRF